MNYKSKFLLYLVFFIGLQNVCWSQKQPPKIIAEGEQDYCPSNPIKIVTDFDIEDLDETEIDAFYIQISAGYTSGEDLLSLNELEHPNINTSWNAGQGKLSLTGIAGAKIPYTDLIAAVKDVVFISTENSNPVNKSFSFTIGSANYLPSTQHYYEYIPDLGITWTDAKAAAATKMYYGLQGYLATITSEEEAILCGEQAAGAGWIGGSDAETEGVWKWMTGPEKGEVFWNGGINGSTPTYANWNFEEPNNAGDEHYAHITAPGIGNRGSWNDLTNTGGTTGDYQPKGYIVEYGSPEEPTPNISASTQIKIPSINSVVPQTICGSGIVTLEATASSGDVVWFDAPTGGTKLFTGSSYTTPSISTTTDYYAMASVNNCLEGKRTRITATVNTIPTITLTDHTICEGGSGTLSAEASAGTINWYEVHSGGTSLKTGTTFTPINQSATTTYYVDATSQGCTSTRAPVTLTVQSTLAPIGNAIQEFCDVDNATIADLSATGNDIVWYNTITEGTPLDPAEALISNTTYYASQTDNACESVSRLKVSVLIHQTATPLLSSEIPPLEVCDAMDDGDDTNGFAQFDLTEMEDILLNGSLAADFKFSYFSDVLRNNLISSPNSYTNTTPDKQTIYVRIENKLNNSCNTEVEFAIQVNPLPVVQSTLTFKNCDEDGIPNGFTDFNLKEIDDIITNGKSADFNISYHTSPVDAKIGNTPINTVLPYNNQTGNIVYARVEDPNSGCHRMSVINLEVSTTSFPSGSLIELKFCDDDDEIDGKRIFDLTEASQDLIDIFPTGQNLSVHYYKSLKDAQLEKNEITNTTEYRNETPFSETLFVRVESQDNGGCYGIGEHVLLTVHPRPEFEVDQSAPFCLSDGPVTLNTFNPKDAYLYRWQDADGANISEAPSVTIDKAGIYTVIATSAEGCDSFPVDFEVKASGLSDIDQNDITILDLSDNNSIRIDTSNIGIGDYEFSLDNEFGPFQDAAFFHYVGAGKHTIYVRDKKGCGTSALNVFVMGFPKFFTPNGDGHNDTWNIKGLSSEYLQNSTVFIYDRYGKLIKQLNLGNDGWDGTFNGQNLNTDDYWFVINLIDDSGKAQVFRGHFSLIR